MPSTLLSNRRIAILEDDPRNRERLSDLVKMSGGDPLPVAPRAPALIELEPFLARERVSMVICDHRLFDRNYATYTGAAAVAASYRSGRGGVLVTAWEKDDAEISIRQFRRWIPVLIHATELKRTLLEEALLQADREARQHLPARQRVPYRTIMTVTSLVSTGGKQVVKVVMSQWNPSLEVGFPVTMLPEGLRAAAVPGNMLIAQVNLEAERHEDLFFDSFEPPDADVLHRTQTFLNHP